MKTLLISTYVFLTITSSTYAHPGNTASDGCHYCRTNCDEWGVGWNERHCHGGVKSAPVQPKVNKVISLPTRKPVRIPTTKPRPTKKTTTIAPTRKPTITARPVKKQILNEANTLVPSKSGFWERLLSFIRK